MKIQKSFKEVRLHNDSGPTRDVGWSNYSYKMYPTSVVNLLTGQTFPLTCTATVVQSKQHTKDKFHWRVIFNKKFDMFGNFNSWLEYICSGIILSFRPKQQHSLNHFSEKVNAKMF